MQEKALCGTNLLLSPIFLVLLLCWALPTLSQTLNREQEIKILKNNFMTEVDVSSLPGQRQKLSFHQLGLHPNGCQGTLRVLARYENYPAYLDYIKSSLYSDSSQMLVLLLDSPVLPFPLELNFKLPRIDHPGSYPFAFPTGIFPGLAGEIKVVEWRHRCLFSVTAHWEGPSTGIPGLIIELFTQTLMERGLEKLFKVSTIH